MEKSLKDLFNISKTKVNKKEIQDRIQKEKEEKELKRELADMEELERKLCEQEKYAEKRRIDQIWEKIHDDEEDPNREEFLKKIDEKSTRRRSAERAEIAKKEAEQKKIEKKEKKRLRNEQQDKEDFEKKPEQEQKEILEHREKQIKQIREAEVKRENKKKAEAEKKRLAGAEEKRLAGAEEKRLEREYKYDCLYRAQKDMGLVQQEEERQQINLEENINSFSEHESKEKLLEKVNSDNKQNSSLGIESDATTKGKRKKLKDMAHAGWTTTKNACTTVWNKPWGKTAIIMTGIVATYAIVSSIVKASRSVQMSGKTRVMPFNNITSGIYNKDIDDRLKFVTALVSIQLRQLCNTGGDVSWDTLQAMMLQCPVLEPDQNKTDAQETFSGKFSETNVSTWFYDVVKKHDTVRK